MEKICKDCNVSKSITKYSKAKKGKYGVRSKCKDCENIYAAKYRKLDGKVEKQRENRIRLRFNISVKEYEEYMSKPCGICNKPSEHLDHNHKTGEIRGGLCSNCNRGLGHFQDNTKNLEGAIKWLKEKGSYST